MKKIITLKPDPDILAFLEKVKYLVLKMPKWKQGVLMASSLSSNSTARPIIVEIVKKKGQK